MLDRWTDISGKLREQQVEASAPCRVDCGGSTDHRLTGLLCRAASPATATIALDLRTVVRLEPHDPGRLAVEAGGLGVEDASLDELPLDGVLGLGFAVLASMGVRGVKAVIEAPVPVRSGLGTSGAVTVAMLGALQVGVAGEPRPRGRRSVLPSH